MKRATLSKIDAFFKPTVDGISIRGTKTKKCNVWSYADLSANNLQEFKPSEKVTEELPPNRKRKRCATCSSKK